MGAFGWPHLLIILAVILLLFGAAKLPALAKSLGQSARVFKGEMKAMKDDDRPGGGDETPTTDVAGSTTTTSSTGETKP
jgi:sec-independent protein translocase protein TatA